MICVENTNFMENYDTHLTRNHFFVWRKHLNYYFNCDKKDISKHIGTDVNSYQLVFKSVFYDIFDDNSGKPNHKYIIQQLHDVINTNHYVISLYILFIVLTWYEQYIFVYWILTVYIVLNHLWVVYVTD